MGIETDIGRNFGIMFHIRFQQHSCSNLKTFVTDQIHRRKVGYRFQLPVSEVGTSHTDSFTSNLHIQPRIGKILLNRPEQFLHKCIVPADVGLETQ